VGVTPHHHTTLGYVIAFGRKPRPITE